MKAIASTSNNEIYDKRHYQVSADLKPYRISQLKKMGPNGKLVIEFLYSKMREENLKPNTRANSIDRLYQLSEFHNHKSFLEMTSEECIFEYLDKKVRKTESEDTLHHWVGTYNNSIAKIIAFFRWLHEPNIHSRERKTPKFLFNVKSLHRRERTTIKPTDLWSYEEDAVFLRYCDDKRLRCYHAMSRETSGRPHELLFLKIGDIIFNNSNGRVYATVTIGREGKTIPRTIPVINSIPYIKDWITNGHPHGESKNHYLFPSLDRKSFMRNKKLETHSLNVLYSNQKSKFFPRLLDDPNIPTKDKQIIRKVLEKPFNPYTRRHIGITEKARQIPEHSLRLYSGWTKTSKMPEVYTHELGDEISNQILELAGIKTRISEDIKLLQPKICPNCSESNKIDSKFCLKCKMILSYDAYTETVETKESEIKGLQDKYDRMESKFDQILSMIQQNPKLLNVKPDSLKAKLS